MTLASAADQLLTPSNPKHQSVWRHDRMNCSLRREKLFDLMKDRSVLLLFSGAPAHISVDAYSPFEANRHFFYLTGLRRENMVLVMKKGNGTVSSTLYIEKTDPFTERWTGKMITAEEARVISGIDDIRYTDRFEREMNFFLSTSDTEYAYFDCYRHSTEDMPHFNLTKAQEFSSRVPGIQVLNLWPLVTSLRMEKDTEETKLLKKAIGITDSALQNVMSCLRPGMYEYQAQAVFEYTLQYQGAEGTSFPTIAGSGKNGTMMHYETNRDLCSDGELLLLDLGAKWEGYNADITRTYPISGKYTERQKKVYSIVLKANRAVAAAAKPGLSLRDLNDLTKQVLAEGCIELGLIKDAGEIGKYYMHSVSHHLGIDVHDVTTPGSVLTPGCVITDEPGLYIDEWGIGIRIEDDLLITENGCECLSEQIIRDPDEIEAFMRDHHREQNI